MHSCPLRWTPPSKPILLSLSSFCLSLKQVGKAGPRVAVTAYSCTVTVQPVTQRHPWPPSADLEELCCEEVDADESKPGRLGGHTGILGQLSRKLHAVWGPGLWMAADGLRPTDQRPQIQSQHLRAHAPLNISRPHLSPTFR